MNFEFLPAARQLAAAYFELYALSIGVEGPLAKSQIRDAGKVFTEMLLAFGMQQLIEFERETSPLSTSDLQSIIVSELRSRDAKASADELELRASLFVRDIQKSRPFFSARLVVR